MAVYRAHGAKARRLPQCGGPPGALAPCGRGVASDQTAVRAALTEPWSNGPTEGHITKLKLVRRQMHGRGKPDLLRARLIARA
jgi:transposase